MSSKGFKIYTNLYTLPRQNHSTTTKTCTNSIKKDIFTKELHWNCKKYFIFYCKFINCTSELLIFETLNTNTHSHSENYQPVLHYVTIRHHI